MNTSSPSRLRVLALGLVTALLMLLTLPLGVVSAGAAGTATIQGTVYGVNDDPSGTNTYHGPLAGVRASAINATSGVWVKSVYTDTSGAYRLSGLPAASYKIKFVKTGWLTTLLPPTAVTAGQTKSLGRTTINAEAVLAGEVLTWDDPPVREVKVTVFNAATGKGVAAVMTTNGGQWRIGQLPPGTYKVRATGYLYEETWANHATTYGGATPYPLVAGQQVVGERENGELSIDMWPLTTIKGTVLGVSASTTGLQWNGPLGGVRVFAIDAGNGKFLKSTYTDAQGNYVLPDLRCGSFTLKYVKSGWLTTTQGPLSLAAAFVAEVPTVTMTGEVTISGQVLSGMDPIPGPAQVTVFNAATGKGAAAVMTDNEGNYTVGQLPAGSYKVRATKSGYYEDWANHAPTYGQAKTYTLVSGDHLVQSWDPLDLYLDLTPITATGTITGSTFGFSSNNEAPNPMVCPGEWDDPIAGILVQAISTTNGAVLGSATTDMVEGYRITGLPAGSYKVKFSANCWTTKWLPGVTVAAGQTVDLGETFVFGEMRIGGTVTDSNDPVNGPKPAAGALVTVRDATTHAVVKTTNADSQGKYFIGQLPVDEGTQGGTFEVQAVEGTNTNDPVQVHIRAGQFPTVNLDYFVCYNLATCGYN